jgi:hypothetical protein
MDGMDGMDGDAEVQLAAALQGIPLEQAALQAKRRRAQALMGVPTPQGQQIGRVYKAASPLEHLASALSRGLGARQDRKIDEESQGLAQRAQEGYAAQARHKEAIRQQDIARQQGNMDRDFGLRAGADARAAASQSSAAELANMQAMAREADAARDAKHQADLLGLQREGLGLKRTELGLTRDQKAAEAEEKAKGARAKGAEDLRKEFQGGSTYKNTQTVAESYRKIADTSPNGPGDISLIFSYMKLLDPGSTVREGEFATAQQAGSVPQTIIARYNAAVEGAKLSPEVRTEFRTEARKLLGAQAARYEETAAPYRRLAQQLGIDPNDVVLDLGLKAMLGPTASAPAAGAGPVPVKSKAERDALPPGTQYVGPDGQTYTKR